jgi:membrane protein YqaA with SNARE-associated domain
MNEFDASDASLGGLFFSAFISATLAPGGSEAVLAYLLSRHEIAVSWLLGAATLGNVLGALTTWGLGFLAARRIGAPLVGQHAKALESLRRWGAPLLLFSWLPVIGDGFCFAAGWLRLSFPASVMAITLGKFARYAAIAFLFD